MIKVNYYDNKFFSAEELQCPTTKQVILAEGFLDKLIELRKKFDRAMIITSCCRSAARNSWLLSRGYPASKNSFHLIENEKWQTGGTCAVDIKTLDKEYQRELMNVAKSLGWSIGIAKTFLHLDRRSDYVNLPQVTYFY